MITTIQLNSNVKKALNNLKEEEKETYEQVILELMRIAQESKRNQEQLLIKGYEEMAEDSLKICEEWKHVDSELDWEWV